jgi:hypothetical protein
VGSFTAQSSAAYLLFAIARDVQLDLKVLWDGRLARPDWAGEKPTPQQIRGFRKRAAHRVIA